MLNKPNIKFIRATLEHRNNIFGWLEEPHVKEFWDVSQGFRDDVLIFMNGRNVPSAYFEGIFEYWIGVIDEDPYCLMMTSEVESSQVDLLGDWRDNLSKSGKTYSIDFMIGNKKYLGKGLAVFTLESFTKFINESVDSTIDTFFIDPEESNLRAKHVYQKAGFKCISEFKRDFNDRNNVTHSLMVKKSCTQKMI